MRLAGRRRIALLGCVALAAIVMSTIRFHPRAPRPSAQRLITLVIPDRRTLLAGPGYSLLEGQRQVVFQGQGVYWQLRGLVKGRRDSWYNARTRIGAGITVAVLRAPEQARAIPYQICSSAGSWSYPFLGPDARLGDSYVSFGPHFSVIFAVGRVVVLLHSNDADPEHQEHYMRVARAIERRLRDAQPREDQLPDPPVGAHYVRGWSPPEYTTPRDFPPPTYWRELVKRGQHYGE
jgi:hypothetical protein